MKSKFTFRELVGEAIRNYTERNYIKSYTVTAVRKRRKVEGRQFEFCNWTAKVSEE